MNCLLSIPVFAGCFLELNDIYWVLRSTNTGLFISKSCLSAHIKLMINETKNTSANEWCFIEGCEKSPSAVILTFFTVTSSLRNKIHVLQL